MPSKSPRNETFKEKNCHNSNLAIKKEKKVEHLWGPSAFLTNKITDSDNNYELGN